MIVYSKKGFLIENPKQNLNHYLQLVRRGLAFLLDILLPGIIQGVLLYIFGWTTLYFISSSVIAIILTVIMFILIPFLNKRTLGMSCAGLYIVHKSGFLTKNGDQIRRGIIATFFYSPPILREISLVISIVWSFFTKGFTPLDFLSATIVVDQKTQKKLVELEMENSLYESIN